MRYTRVLSTVLFLGGIAACAPADEHGKRLGTLLADYARAPEVLRLLRNRKLPADLSNAEMNQLLRLFESRIGAERTIERVRRSPQTVAHLRLVRVQAFLELADLLLLPEDTNRSLARAFTPLATREVYAFIANRAVRDRFYCLPEAFLEPAVKRTVFGALELAIAAEGYPLPAGRTEDIATFIVPELAQALAKVRRFRPQRPCASQVAQTPAEPADD